MENEERIAGALLGTALGDALGLATEGLSADVIARRFGRVRRFHLLGRTGFVSDDTEQSALVAQSLARHPDDLARCVRAFRRAMLGWFARLPWGIGLGTLRACVRLALGLRRSGVRSAGNGAAMRSAVVGVFYADAPTVRRATAAALAEVTHVDPRAVQGAVFVAELAAACARLPQGTELRDAFDRARGVVTEPTLGAALDRARTLAVAEATVREAADALGTTGFVVHTVPFAAYCFLRRGREPLDAVSEAIAAGGDTDSIAAIVGAWSGALGGEASLPADLLARIHDGPFGPSHLRALAADLVRARDGGGAPRAGYSYAYALARNVALFPIVLLHGMRRLLPPYAAARTPGHDEAGPG